MNQDNGTMMICPRCGKEMNSNSRYCLQCGYLNPNVQANQGMKKYIEKNKDNTYHVGSGQTIMQKTDQIVNSIGNNTGNKVICFLFNYLLYIGTIILSFMLIVGDKVNGFGTVKNSLLPYVVLLVSIVFLYVYSMELVFMKANRKWWYALIPFYNLFVLSDIVYKKKWLGIILIIPVIGQLFLIVTFYKLAIKFKYSGLLTIIFPIIFIPLMGFGSRLYEGINYVNEDRTLEKDYKRKRVFFISLILFLVISFLIIFWNNIVEIKSKAFRLQNYYYVYATKQMVNKTKKLVSSRYFECDKYQYNENKGKYYIEYSDIGEVAYIPFHAYRDEIEGYVIIDNTSGSSKYYVSVSDGTYGYPETLYDDVSVDSIVSYPKLVEKNNINYCIYNKEKANMSEVK